MLNMKNKSIILLIASLLLSISIASADDSNISTSSETRVMTWSGENMKNLKDARIESRVEVKKENRTETKVNARVEARTEIKMTKEEIKAKRVELKEEVRSKKEEIKTNREEYKKDRWELKEIFSEVTDEQKEKLKTLREEHRETVEEIKERFKDKELTLEEREQLRIELDMEIQAYAEAVSEIVWGNVSVNQYVDSRLELRNKNKSIREDIKDSREEFRGERSELVLEFKETYYWKVSQVIPKLADSNLEKLSGKIDTLITKTEANTRLSETNKDKMIAQLISLKEIIDEELETREILNEDLELELEIELN